MQFDKLLQDFELTGTKEKAISLWIKVPLSLSRFIEPIAARGFKYHHAENDSSMLMKWLPLTRPCAVPPFATHQIGVGGLVEHDNGKILAVKDRHGLVSTWKLPGGLTNLGEDLGDAAIREVREETGVESTFCSLVAMRHQHGLSWGRSDMYFICRLRATTEHITMDPREISDCAWMTREQFIAEANPNSLTTFVLKQQPPVLELSQRTLSSIVVPDKTYKLYFGDTLHPRGLQS